MQRYKKFFKLVISVGKMEMVNLFKRKVEDLKWFKLNFKSIQETYAGGYIAIEDLRIIGHDENYSNLLEKLKGEGYDTSKVLIKKVPAKEEFLVYYG